MCCVPQRMSLIFEWIQIALGKLGNLTLTKVHLEFTSDTESNELEYTNITVALSYNTNLGINSFKFQYAKDFLKL